MTPHRHQKACNDLRAPDGRGRGVQVGDGNDTIAYTAAAVEVAESNPRLLIDEPGWHATTVYGFTKDEGTIAFTNGDREIEMNWYPAASYDGYYEDRTEVSDREPITIDGQPGSRVVYETGDVAAMLEPDEDAFVEIRSAGFDSTTDVLATFATMKHVSVDTWLAALPPEVAVAGEAEKVAEELLGDVPAPPGFTTAGFESMGVNSRYYVGVELIDRVECGWLKEWERADAAGEVEAVERAVTALRSARGWDVLAEMHETGEYSEGPWQIAAEATVEGGPGRHLEMFGCAGR
ncbi:MAG: hypothetical protein ABW075_07555 [Aeromicrobium sp.]